LRAVTLSLLAALSVAALVPPGASADTPPGVAEAEAVLEAARANARALEARLDALEAELVSAEDSLAELTGQQAELVEQLVSTEAQVRDYVVNSYVNGGEPPVLALGGDGDGGTDLVDLSWREQVLQAAAVERRKDLDLLADLRTQLGAETASAASRVESLGAQVTDLRNDLIQASAHEREAEDALESARQSAWDEAVRRAEEERRNREQAAREQALANARGSGSAGAGKPSAPIPAPGPTGIAGDPTPAELAVLAKIRRCESRGNYSIVNPSGKYRGAYQFDRRTWAGVGGVGDPAAAPPHEQDYRALLLYRSRGGRPWPNCS
jgi:predicted  nucleic acid-binding Zn-ribbon protein